MGVVVAAHGPVPYLDEALAGVLGQDPAPDRVVVVDDGSMDPVRLSPAHSERCELVRLAGQGGPAAAREEALARLDTDLVAVADADDVWDEGKLAAQLDALARHPEAAVCFGRAVVVGPDGLPTGEQWRELPPGIVAPDLLARLLFEENPIPTSSTVIRRPALVAAGGFASPFPPCEDLDLWMRLAERGERFVCEPTATIRYRRHPSALTADLVALGRSELAVREAHRDLVSDEILCHAQARSLVAVARGRVRQRRYADARRALGEAAAAGGLAPRERALSAVLAVPGLRALLGRRDPYLGRRT